jgi:hypothetical protein
MTPVVLDAGVLVAGILIMLQKPFGIRILTPRAWLATLSRADRRKLQ